VTGVTVLLSLLRVECHLFPVCYFPQCSLLQCHGILKRIFLRVALMLLILSFSLASKTLMGQCLQIEGRIHLPRLVVSSANGISLSYHFLIHWIVIEQSFPLMGSWKLSYALWCFQWPPSSHEGRKTCVASPNQCPRGRRRLVLPFVSCSYLI
jgi:hypothetical protein